MFPTLPFSTNVRSTDTAVARRTDRRFASERNKSVQVRPSRSRGSHAFLTRIISSWRAARQAAEAKSALRMRENHFSGRRSPEPFNIPPTAVTASCADGRKERASRTRQRAERKRGIHLRIPGTGFFMSWAIYP